MPEWEIKPFEQFPQTPELYLEQIDQELDSLKHRYEYLIEEKARMVRELGRLADENS